MRHLRGGIGARCGRCATVPRCAPCGASPCPVRCVPVCGWAVTPSDRLRGCVGFCGGCGGAFLIQWYLRPPCAPVVPCGGSVCPLRGSDGVPCPAPPLRTICRPAWPVVRPVASVGSVCGVGWVSASPPPIAPPVPSCALSQRPTLTPWLCPASATICALRPASRLLWSVGRVCAAPLLSGYALPLLTLSGSPQPRQLHHLRRHPLRLSPISYTHPGVSYFVDTVSVCIFIH